MARHVGNESYNYVTSSLLNTSSQSLPVLHMSPHTDYSKFLWLLLTHISEEVCLTFQIDIVKDMLKMYKKLSHRMKPDASLKMDF